MTQLEMVGFRMPSIKSGVATVFPRLSASGVCFLQFCFSYGLLLASMYFMLIFEPFRSCFLTLTVLRRLYLAWEPSSSFYCRNGGFSPVWQNVEQSNHKWMVASSLDSCGDSSWWKNNHRSTDHVCGHGYWSGRRVLYVCYMHRWEHVRICKHVRSCARASFHVFLSCELFWGVKGLKSQ